MKDIACAILSVGLCFYEAYLKKEGLKPDVLAAGVAFIAAIVVIL